MVKFKVQEGDSIGDALPGDILKCKVVFRDNIFRYRALLYFPKSKKVHSSFVLFAEQGNNFWRSIKNRTCNYLNVYERPTIEG